MTTKIKATNIWKKFNNLEVLKGIDLEVNEGEVVAVIGPSGGGKSTLLRCLNKLETSRDAVKTVEYGANDILVNILWSLSAIWHGKYLGTVLRSKYLVSTLIIVNRKILCI